ncbi:hypothetical protein SKAU_G00429770 [Synaphobranchus kaupii]|uniref:Uncharacterized protein n=1 Tax=Synaphobranchus kaupii TaxID=118154 RepID=A0A9Q1IA22_SYNKA|nr:hypothetical protein SKAU_G00429770 [Synaphobranchus kaupii]
MVPPAPRGEETTPSQSCWTWLGPWKARAGRVNPHPRCAEPPRPCRARVGADGPLAEGRAPLGPKPLLEGV